MRKISLCVILGLMFAVGLPTSGYSNNEDAPKSQSKSSKAKKSKKGDTKKVQESSEVSESGMAVAEEAVGGTNVIKFSDEQIMLNNQAVDAGNAGDYKKAEALLIAMLAGGEMNIIWGNLGGVYAKQGKCIEAKDAFERVWHSPKITEIPAEAIEEGARQALEKLKDQCTAKIQLKCQPADMTVTFDDGKAYACTTEDIAVTPGKHRIYAKTGYGFNYVDVEAVENETRTYAVEVVNYEQIASDAGVSPEQLRRKSHTFKAIGWSFFGVGAAAAIGGGVLMWHSWSTYTDKRDEYMQRPGNSALKESVDKDRDTYQTRINASYGMLAVGGAMLVTGLVLIIYDAVKLQPQIENFASGTSAFSWDVAPSFSPEFSGLSFSGRF